MGGRIMKKLILVIVGMFIVFGYGTEVMGADFDQLAYTVEGVTDGDEFTDDVEIHFGDIDSYVLNGESVDVYGNATISINEVGYYTLDVYADGSLQESYSFTVHPRLLREFDGMEFNDFVVAYVDNVADIYVNGELVTNGEKLSVIGNYEMEIRGVNGYSAFYSFKIHYSVLEFAQDLGLSRPLSVDVDKFVAVYLFKEIQHEDFKLELFGHYELKVFGINGYYKNYSFNYEAKVTSLVDDGIYQGFIKIKKSDAVRLYIDGEIVTGDRYLSEIGHHEIRYTGVNGYERTYNITIIEDDLEIDGKVYTSFRLVFTKFDLYIDGEKYTSGSTVYTVGYHTVTVKGSNGYVHDYHITIYDTPDMPQQGDTNEAFNIVSNYERVYVNGALVENYRVTETGEYEIVFWGEGGLTETYYYNYTNDHVEDARLMTYGVGGLALMTLVSYVFVLIRRFR
jgi:hypothetical protein